MENTRIYSILSQLDKPILNRFIKFIDSPYHNMNKKVATLAHLLINTIKQEEKLPSKQEIWEIIFESNAYEDVKFRKLCNDVLERFENFLVIEELNENTLMKANLLLTSLKHRNIPQVIEKHINKSSRLIDREMDQSSDYYLQKYFYWRNQQNLKTNYEKKANLKTFLLNYDYQSLSQNLDAFYVVEKLRHAIDIITWRKMYKTEIIFELDYAKDLISKYELEKIPTVRVYQLMYYLLSGQSNETGYFELKSLVEKFVDSFPVDEQKELLDVLLNFCLKQILSGIQEGKYYNELLNLYDWGIDSEIILSKGVLSPTTFRNYVLSGLRIGEFERVEQFIYSKSILLESKRRENAINFNLARMSFHKKEFNDALEYLSKVNYDDIWYHLNSRSQLLAVYYELKEDFVLESQIDSFMTFVRRDKLIQDSYRKLYLNFAKYLKRIIKLNPRDKSAIQKLKEAIENESAVNNKSWLLEKIDELL